ncbi:glycoside hydrolase family 92 protein [Sistotremastrum niveocremeum HHB9708]|uniref:Glycoside hydrolase family 92 protein n=1 Tax=Sistotremastrum niveocremeum HHB9708 TaxID=1314777 RepID=A0A164VJX8_9AGAM|nr:glycoside hydrolase family 92 protein [Sistotremastrum niveocremeum HHB9708]
MSWTKLWIATACLCFCGLCVANEVPDAFRVPLSENVDHVNPMIGNGGWDPNNSGGMIPSTAPPFAMTRWVAQTRQNYVSMTPYNQTDTKIHGFQGTHQPAIWMGESGQVVVCPGLGTKVNAAFEERGLRFNRSNEVSTASYYSALLEVDVGSNIFAEQSATSRVGHLRFTFDAKDSSLIPYVVVQATRAFRLGSSNPENTTSPIGTITINPASREIAGRNPERQDFIIGPSPAHSFAGYFVARFDTPFESFGTATNATLHEGESARNDTILSGYVRFPVGTTVVNVRIGVSYISVEQARRNLDNEIPDGRSLESTAEQTRTAWAEKLDRIQLEGATDFDKRIFYTGFFHTLQYPNEQSEDGRYYSGYDDSIHQGESYTGYSIWDTYRAEWAWQILFAPERIAPMITSMLQDFQEGGWLPMWKNIVAETNIMIGTDADSMIAEALIKGVTGFDLDLAWTAVHKDATVPPEGDATIEYDDRQENVGYEVRAGLSSVYSQYGWVADDIHSESASRTLRYAFDDYAVYAVAEALNRTEDAQYFLERSKSYRTIYNNATGFMEARNADGSWAGPDRGWTEGDKWAYTFDVVQDVPGLIDLLGGNETFVKFLDRHFLEGHNDHTNEPSHHIPYLYSFAGAAFKAQERIRQIARTDYNDTASGLAGNEDCGQMSAWYLFSALGFYPVNPSSDIYVVGSPFFDKVTINLPGVTKPLIIQAPGAPGNIYIDSLTIDGIVSDSPFIRHEQFAKGGVVEFKMSPEPTAWGSDAVDSVNPEGTSQKHLEL